jgi:hypothetical protein
VRLPPGKQPNTSTQGSIEFASILHRNAKHKILTHAPPQLFREPRHHSHFGSRYKLCCSGRPNFFAHLVSWFMHGLSTHKPSHVAATGTKVLPKMPLSSNEEVEVCSFLGPRAAGQPHGAVSERLLLPGAVAAVAAATTMATRPCPAATAVTANCNTRNVDTIALYSHIADLLPTGLIAQLVRAYR